MDTLRAEWIMRTEEKTFKCQKKICYTQDPHKLILKKVVLKRFSDFVQCTKNVKKKKNTAIISYLFATNYFCRYYGQINNFEKYLTIAQCWSEI